MNKNIFKLFYISIPVIIIDQLTKRIVEKNIFLGGRVNIIKGILDISHVSNNGAAFGILRGWNWIFIIITLIAIGFVFFYYRRFQESNWMRTSLGFLLGGAIGNLIDRIRIGHVTDFVDFRFWPSFNVADISVSIGAVMLLIYMLRYNEEPNTITD